jgi:hypothetical protein
MAMASGIVGPGKKFAVVDTENRRASHYADLFNFDVLDFAAPFSSSRYAEAVKQVYEQKYDAIVVDSFSHEHDGQSGYLDAQAKKLDEMVKRSLAKHPNKSEWEIAEKLTPLSWNEPKRDRRHMLEALLACSVDIPLIFCIRADEKYFTTKDGKLVAREKPEWEPLCGRGMMFEMTVSFMLYANKPGYPVPIKLQEQHKKLFPLDKPIGAESGRLIAEWAKGSASPVEEPDAETSAKILADWTGRVNDCADAEALKYLWTQLTDFIKAKMTTADKAQLKEVGQAKQKTFKAKAA